MNRRLRQIAYKRDTVVRGAAGMRRARTTASVPAVEHLQTGQLFSWSPWAASGQKLEGQGRSGLTVEGPVETGEQCCAVRERIDPVTGARIDAAGAGAIQATYGDYIKVRRKAGRRLSTYGVGMVVGGTSKLGDSVTVTRRERPTSTKSIKTLQSAQNKPQENAQGLSAPLLLALDSILVWRRPRGISSALPMIADPRIGLSSPRDVLRLVRPQLPRQELDEDGFEGTTLFAKSMAGSVNRVDSAA
ncbi:hypothetical protein C8R47DRAFT_1070912 [Mycena vitilis]|nr:hypothetical protein C8R47DRAFT_1070912 [Mycena vitilis]